MKSAPRTSNRPQHTTYGLLAATVACGVVVHAAGGTVVYANARAAASLRLPPGQLLGSSPLDPRWRALREDGSDFPAEEHPALVALRTGRPQPAVTLGHLAPGGDIRWLQLDAVPLRTGRGRLSRVVLTIVDVTARKQAEAGLREERDMLQGLLDVVPDLIYFKDRSSRYLRINRALAAAYGLQSPDEAIGKSDFDYYPAAAAAEYFAREQQILASGVPMVNEREDISGQRGCDTWLLSTKVPLVRNGQIAGLAGVSRDMTAHYQALAALHASEERYRRIVETAQEGIWQLDAEDRTTFVNQAMADMLGYTVEEMQGTPLHQYESSSALGTSRERVERRRRGLRETYDVRFRRRDGGRLWALVSAGPIMDEQGRYAGALAMVTDITARKQAEEALRHQASHDSLTGLPNRAFLHEHLEGAIQVARDTRQPLSLLLLDLDRFKEVNDTLGHHIGDVLLRQVAQRLQQAVGATDTISRLGGDEFAIILPAAGPEAAGGVARLVLGALGAPFQMGQHMLELSGSIGIAAYPQHGADTPTLLQHADVAMYVAKRAQSGVALYEPVLDRHTVRRLALMHELRRAIREEGLYLYYQPQVALATGQVCGVEALLRWSHPLHGFIPPAEFIPLAEQTGVIVALTEWILLTALRQAAAWRKAGQPIPIAINLSARSLQDQQFPDLVARHLRRYGVAPADLTLEITESSLMTDPLRAREVLIGLHGLGVHMAIDDFGTGYSSLGYLKNLPVDEVKIDKSFVLGMGAGDQKDAAIVRSVVAMAHALGLKVVAEGVEDADTYALLGGLGCDIAQGYYLSRPQPAEDLERWLGSYRGCRDEAAGHAAPPARGLPGAGAGRTSRRE